MQHTSYTPTLTYVATGTNAAPVTNITLSNPFFQKANNGTLKLDGVDSLGIVCLPTNTTGTTQAFTSTGSNNVLTTGTVVNGYAAGQVVTVTGTGLPSGLGTGTSYYIIPVNGTSVEFADTYAHALAGTGIVSLGTTAGSGNIVPTALSGGSAQLQVSNDGTNFVNQGSAVAITAGTNFTISLDRPAYMYGQLAITVSAGQLTVNAQVCAKTDKFTV